MDKSEKSRFFSLLLDMGEVYNKKLTPTLRELYWDILRE
jgi:hypothetical protein